MGERLFVDSKTIKEYKELQIHGEINLAEHATHLVVHHSHQGDVTINSKLAALKEKLPGLEIVHMPASKTDLISLPVWSWLSRTLHDPTAGASECMWRLFGVFACHAFEEGRQSARVG